MCVATFMRRVCVWFGVTGCFKLYSSNRDVHFNNLLLTEHIGRKKRCTMSNMNPKHGAYLHVLEQKLCDRSLQFVQYACARCMYAGVWITALLNQHRFTSIGSSIN